MPIKIEMPGLEQAVSAMTGARAHFADAVKKEVIRAGFRVDAEIKESMQQTPRTGAIYRRRRGRNLSRTHRASSPGYPPAIDTGTLIRSITFRISDNGLTSTVSSNAVYAAALEYGDDRIDARPSWRPAVEIVRPEFQRRLEAVIEAAFR